MGDFLCCSRITKTIHRRYRAEELFRKAKRQLDIDFLSMCVTPKDIVAMVKDGASILSYGLNLALFGEDYEALEGLMR